MTKKLVAMNLVLVCFLLLSPVMVFAQPAWCDPDNPTCEGDFNCDCDVDGTDAAQFKSDFGRGQFSIPCPECSSSNAELEARVAYLEALLANVTRVTVEGQDTIRFSGMNVQIVSGSGMTDGAVNGLGNLIVGYNELRVFGDDRTGSHNIVVGKGQNYSSYGGLVAGYNNTISGQYASVSGGTANTANASRASVSGGFGNTANASHASVSGGLGNTASGYIASVSGGYHNTASGEYASASGGAWNIASGDYSFVGGGGTFGYQLSGNTAFAHYSTVLGGQNNVAGDPTLTDHTIGENSSVNGGAFNRASGWFSSVSGGAYNIASSDYASVSGGGGNIASGSYASVSGGSYNTASGLAASVSGGENDIANGYAASVSGGLNRSAAGDFDWAAGALWEDQ